MGYQLRWIANYFRELHELLTNRCVAPFEQRGFQFHALPLDTRQLWSPWHLADHLQDRCK